MMLTAPDGGVHSDSRREALDGGERIPRAAHGAAAAADAAPGRAGSEAVNRRRCLLAALGLATAICCRLRVRAGARAASGRAEAARSGPLPDRAHRRRQARGHVHRTRSRARGRQAARIPRHQSRGHEGIRDAAGARRHRQRIQPGMHPDRARARSQTGALPTVQPSRPGRTAGRHLCRLVRAWPAATGYRRPRRCSIRTRA